MQTANVNLPITVTGRHVTVTEAMREHAHKKVDSLHLDYPKIIEAKVILDVESGFRHVAEIVLFCANHITIEASSTTEDMYASIDETISKIARRMRKYKTRMMKRNRPKKGSVQHLDEQVFARMQEVEGNDLPEIPEPATAAAATESEDDLHEEPSWVHKEQYRVRPLYTDEAIMEVEMNERHFVVFRNAKNDKLSIVYRRNDGDYGLIEPKVEEA